MPRLVLQPLSQLGTLLEHAGLIHGKCRIPHREYKSKPSRTKRDLNLLSRFHFAVTLAAVSMVDCGFEQSRSARIPPMECPHGPDLTFGAIAVHSAENDLCTSVGNIGHPEAVLACPR